MALFETLVALLLISALLLQLSRKLRVPYPTLLALAGTVFAALPWAPQVGIDPALALVLFVAPAILSAAFDTSPHELRRNLVPLVALAVFAVLLTTAAVAWAGVAVAGLPLAAAVALGAIVAPPDAAAAQAMLGNLGLPRRLMVVLQGESLFNDAVALIIFGAAVALAQGGVRPIELLPQLALAVPGGILLGAVTATAFIALRRNWAGTLGVTILEFSATFLVWMTAEHLHVSPVLAMVTHAMVAARSAPWRQDARDRQHSYAVWDAAVFILNVLAFLLMGLQARAILAQMEGHALWQALGFAALVFGIVVAVRLAWVMSYRYVFAPFAGRLACPSQDDGNARLRLIVSWCGMRGILTLATALSLPLAFPGRNLIVLSAFAVVLGTLVVQGATVALLMRWLGIEPDRSLDDDVEAARTILADARRQALRGDTAPLLAWSVPVESIAVFRPPHLPPAAGYRRLDASSSFDVMLDDGLVEPTPADERRLAIVAAERYALNALHRRGDLAEDAFRVLQQELDWRELALMPRHARELGET